MAKDFAFLFCPGDYLRDTQCLSEKSQVAYDRIMCEHIRSVSNDMESIWIAQDKVSFFAKRLNDDERAELYHVLRKDGSENRGFQIEWVAEKVAERQRYIDSRTGNGSVEKKPKAYAKHKKAYDKLPDSDNEIESNSKKEKKSEKAKNATQEVFEVVEHLNIRSGRKFNAERQQTANLIISRLKEGYTVADLKKIIDCKVEKWGNDDKMRQFLRPETLFAPSKIDGYLQDANDPKITRPQNGHDPRYSATFVKDKA